VRKVIAAKPPPVPARIKIKPAMNCRCGLSIPAFGQTRKFTQVMGHGFEAARTHPPLRLLVHHLPGRQVVGHHAPLATATHDVTQRVEHFPQG
jgi:hypothetical protein